MAGVSPTWWEIALALGKRLVVQVPLSPTSEFDGSSNYNNNKPIRGCIERRKNRLYLLNGSQVACPRLKAAHSVWDQLQEELEAENGRTNLHPSSGTNKHSGCGVLYEDMQVPSVKFACSLVGGRNTITTKVTKLLYISSWRGFITDGRKGLMVELDAESLEDTDEAIAQELRKRFGQPNHVFVSLRRIGPDGTVLRLDSRPLVTITALNRADFEEEDPVEWFVGFVDTRSVTDLLSNLSLSRLEVKV